MGRRQKIEVNSDGSAEIRVSIQPYTWGLIAKYANKLKLNVEDAARIFLAQIEAQIGDGCPSWLSADWQVVARAASDDVAPALTGIDLTGLHRSTRTKSGFVGVYANGAGFRATGRRGEPLGTYKTAEIAAYKRMQHYRANGLPYGPLEEEIDRLRADGEQGTDEQLKAVAIQVAQDCGTMHLLFPNGASQDGPKPAGFGDGGLEAAAAALREHDDAEEQREASPPKKRGRPRKGEP